MRIFLLAAVSACVAGAAWADAGEPAPLSDSVYSARIAEEVTRTVDAALGHALADIEALPMDETTLRDVRAAIEAARIEVRVELAARDGRLDSLSAREEAELEARLEGALANVSDAVDRAAAAWAAEQDLGR